MQCLKCGYDFELKEGTKFCPQCGGMIEEDFTENSQKIFCQICGKLLNTEDMFCPSCGVQVNRNFQIEKSDMQQSSTNLNEKTVTNKRFCSECGWDISGVTNYCPRCGKTLQSKRRQPVSQEYQNAAMNLKDDFSITRYRITGRQILRFLILLIVICFFCPMFMVSCSGIEYNAKKISGTELVTGLNYMGESVMDGNLFYLPLLVLPAIALVYLFLTKQRKWHGIVSAASCGSCSLILLTVYFFVKIKFENGVNDWNTTNLEFKALIAFYLYIVLCLIVVIIGVYIDFLYKQEESVRIGKRLSVSKLRRESIVNVFLGILTGLMLFLMLFTLFEPVSWLQNLNS